MSNLKSLFFWFPPHAFPKEVMIWVKVEFFINSSPTQIHHGDEPGPLLGPLQLESKPKFMLNRFTSVRGRQN